MASEESSYHDVTVVGAGWSGMAACKSMLEEGLTAVCLEAREGIGGLWQYSDDPNLTTVMKSTRTTSSSTFTEMSDFPMPKEIGEFPHNKDIMNYLCAYAAKFNLMPHIKVNSEVKAVKKEGDMWITTCITGQVYTSKHLIVATGVHQAPNLEPRDTILKDFAGKVYHAQQIKMPLEVHRGQRLLVLGGGETSSDICTEWRDHMEFVYWSIPRGQHFFRKYATIVPWRKPEALDKASSRALLNINPPDKSKPGLSWLCKWTTAGSLLAYQGHGIPEWRNDASFFHAFINKNGKVLDPIDYEKFVPKGAIVECNGKEITFIDGTKQEFDVAIMATGYTVDFPFLPKQHAEQGLRDRLKFVFDVEDTTLAFVGMVRPVLGSIVAISELQARWAARVWVNKIQLPSLKERRETVQKDANFWSNYFKDTSQRLQGLVEVYIYVDDVAKCAGVYPDYWALLKRNPGNWLISVLSPFNPAFYRLNEPEHEEQCIVTLKSHKKGSANPVHLLVFLFFRLIWFDWWLDQLCYIKYRIQISSWWPKVRSLKAVQGANYVWCLPKKVLFDNKSDV